MNINLHLHEFEGYLNQHNLVGSHSAENPRVNNLSFDQIKSCCSLSNKGLVNRTYNRSIVFFKTFQWMDDKKIGTSLFFEYLWVNSAISNDLGHWQSRKPEMLAQIQLIDKIFSEIVLPGYKQGKLIPNTNVQSFPEENKANPEISSMFPVSIGTTTGASSAMRIADNIKMLFNIYNQDFQGTLKAVENSFYLQTKLKRAHRFETGQATTQICWTQSVFSPLLPLPITWKATCKSKDTEEGRIKHECPQQEGEWWRIRSAEGKIEAFQGKQLTLNTKSRPYLKGAVPPYNIQVSLTEPGDIN